MHPWQGAVWIGLFFSSAVVPQFLLFHSLAYRILSFVLYGLFNFVLSIGIAMAVIFFALLTCCVGLLLIAIPYVGAVVLLPVSYTIRAFSIEFRAQFGEKYKVFSPGENVLKSDKE